MTITDLQGSMKRGLLGVFVLLAAWGLAGCSPILAKVRPAVITPTGQVATPAATETPSLADDSNRSCAYVWDSRPLDVETNMVQAAFTAKGLTDVSVRLEAYGESCVDTVADRIVRFTAMETDFYLTIAVDALEDQAALGSRLVESLWVLLAFPGDSFPGLNPARVFVRFTSAEESSNLAFNLDQARQRVEEEGLSGGALLEALASP